MDEVEPYLQTMQLPKQQQAANRANLSARKFQTEPLFKTERNISGAPCAHQVMNEISPETTLEG